MSPYLKDDSIKIRCKVTVLQESKHKDHHRSFTATAAIRSAPAPRRPPSQPGRSGCDVRGRWGNVHSAQEYARHSIAGVHGGALRTDEGEGIGAYADQ